MTRSSISMVMFAFEILAVLAFSGIICVDIGVGMVLQEDTGTVRCYPWIRIEGGGSVQASGCTRANASKWSGWR